MKACNTHLKEVLKTTIFDRSLKITNSKLQPPLPWVNSHLPWFAGRCAPKPFAPGACREWDPPGCHICDNKHTRLHYIRWYPEKIHNISVDDSSNSISLDTQRNTASKRRHGLVFRNNGIIITSCSHWDGMAWMHGIPHKQYHQSSKPLIFPPQPFQITLPSPLTHHQPPRLPYSLTWPATSRRDFSPAPGPRSPSGMRSHHRSPRCSHR